MKENLPVFPLTRRKALALGGGIAASSLMPIPLFLGGAAATATARGQSIGPFEDGERPAAALTSSTNTYQEYQPVVTLPVHPDEPHLRVIQRDDGTQELVTLSRTASINHELSIFVQDRILFRLAADYPGGAGSV